jgi:hypothetical protein
MAKCEFDEFKRQNLRKDFAIFDFGGATGVWVERHIVTDQLRSEAQKLLDALWATARKYWIVWLRKCPPWGTKVLCAVHADDNNPPWTVTQQSLIFQFDYAESAGEGLSRFKIVATFDQLRRRLTGECIRKGDTQPQHVRFTSGKTETD